MFPAFIAGFIYTFMTAIVSLSAVVFLVSPGFQLAAVKIFDAAVYGEIGIAVGHDDETGPDRHDLHG